MGTKKPSSRSMNMEELPEEIRQHILSFMNYDDVVRVSGVSKAWTEVASTLRCLNLSDDFFVHAPDGRPPPSESIEKVKSMLSSANRFVCELQQQNVRMDKLSFKFWVNPLLKFYVMNAVFDLHLNCKENIREFVLDGGDYNILPEHLVLHFCASRFLQKLVLGGLWKFSMKELLLLGGKIDLPWLREFYLRCSYIDDELLENFVKNSPKLEFLQIIDCWGFRTLKILGSQKNFKRLVMETKRNKVKANRFEIRDVPNEYLRYRGDKLFALVNNVDVSAYENLKILELMIISSGGDEKLFDAIQPFVSNLKALEVFKFTWEIRGGKSFGNYMRPITIRISSDSIKELWISLVCVRGDIQVDAPYLSKFYYSGSLFSRLTLKASSSSLSIKEANIVRRSMDEIRIVNLIGFLKSFNHFGQLEISCDDSYSLYFGNRHTSHIIHFRFYFLQSRGQLNFLSNSYRKSKCVEHWCPTDLDCWGNLKTG